MEAYMTAPRFDLRQTRDDFQTDGFDSSLKNSLGKNSVLCSTPSVIKTSAINLPWRANTYYGAATGNPSLPNALSMPEPKFKGHMLGTLDPVKVAPIFSAARNNLYTRYTPGNWKASNASNVLFGEKVRNDSSQLRSEAIDLCRELEDKTKRSQEVAGQEFGERISNVEHLKEEVKTELDSLIHENEALMDCLKVLEKVSMDLSQPLQVAQECLYGREKRRGIDLVHDDVEKELIREIDVIKKCQNESKSRMDQMNVQLALNRAAQHELEKDLSDKVVTLHLDNRCHGMNNMTRHLKYYDGIHRIDNATSIPPTWFQFSSNNIKRSIAERTASRDLRRIVEVTCSTVTSQVEDQKNKVNDALAERLKEYKRTKNAIQENLLKTLEEIEEMERVIDLLKQSILSKEQPIQLAQTRLSTRIGRPNVEACRDRPHEKLVDEIYEINETVDQLRIKLRQSEISLQLLLKAKLSLEHDLNIKVNSIKVDLDLAQGLRVTPPRVYLGTTMRV